MRVRGGELDHGKLYFWLKILGGASLGVGVIFAGHWMLMSVPYGLFLLLPFVALTAGIGFSLVHVCTRKHAQANRYTAPRVVNYRELIIVIPLFVILIYTAFGTPSSHFLLNKDSKSFETAKRTDAKEVKIAVKSSVKHRGKVLAERTPSPEVIPPALEWPWLNQSFNFVNSWWQGLFSDSYLKEGRAYQSVVFDREELALIVWLAMLFSGPFLFWRLTRNGIKAVQDEQSSKMERMLKRERETWSDRLKISEQNRERQVGLLSRQIEADKKFTELRMAEIEELRAKITHARDVQVVQAKGSGEKRPGVLDSDLL